MPAPAATPTGLPWLVATVLAVTVLVAGVVSAGVVRSRRPAELAVARAVAVGPASDRSPVLVGLAGSGPTQVTTPPPSVPLVRGGHLEISLPPGPGPFPVVLYAHGGGWVAGDPGDIPPEFGIGAVTGAGWALVSVGYRLADEATGVTARDQADDVRDALTWVREEGAAMGLGPVVVAVGHSAGAQLVSVAAASVPPSLAPDEVVAISGLYDFGPDVVSAPLLRPVLATAFGCPVGACAVDDLEPTRLVHAGEPSVTIVHGAADPIAAVGSARRYADALAAVGVPVDLRIVPGGHHAGDALGAVVRAVLADVLRRSGAV